MDFNNLLKVIVHAGNFKSLCSVTLDLLRCMQLSLGLSKSNVVKKHDIKTKKCKSSIAYGNHTYDLDVPRFIPSWWRCWKHHRICILSVFPLDLSSYRSRHKKSASFSFLLLGWLRFLSCDSLEDKMAKSLYLKP